MTDTFSVTKCLGCGQVNRHPNDVGRSGTFACGKCGKPLLSVVADKPKPSSDVNWGMRITLAILAVVVIFIVNASNIHRPVPVTSAKLTPSPLPSLRPTPGSTPYAKGLSSLFEKTTPKPSPSPSPLSQSGGTTAATRLEELSTSPSGSPPGGSLAAAFDRAPGNVGEGEPARPLGSKIVSAPATGELRLGLGHGATAPFKIITDGGSNYLIKLVNAANGRDQLVIFVRSGDSFETQVALGEYRFLAAAGQAWYGRAELFGPTTQFFRLHDKGAGSGAHILRFSRDGSSDRVIVLKPVLGGDLEWETMSKADFDAN